MTAYMTKIRIYYKDAKGKQKIAPANTVVSDMPEEVAEKHMADGYLREATIGEIAEANPAAVLAEKKPRAKKPKDDETSEAPTSDDLA